MLAAKELAYDCYADTITQPNRYVAESLLDGVAGVVLVKALVDHGPTAHRPPDPIQGDLQALLASYTQCCHSAVTDAQASDEFLYGRVGTLFGALLLNHTFGPTAVSHDTMEQLLQAVLHSGRSLARLYPQFGSPLFYVWPAGRHASPYLGAAHGLMGIAYVLLHCSHWLEDQQAWMDIKGTLRCVLSLEQDAPGRAGKGGHYPVMMSPDTAAAAPAGPAVDPHEPALVHWCHGAPGAVYLFTKAAEVLPEEASVYLAAACRAGDLVWEEGLLKKGPGLCHGVSGNAYALLRLCKATGEDKWLRSCEHFATFMCSNEGQADWQTPDHPLALYEGLAGGACLLSDLLDDPGKAAFPLFELG